MAQRTSLPGEPSTGATQSTPPAASISQAPPSPPKSLWKRILKRNPDAAAVAEGAVSNAVAEPHVTAPASASAPAPASASASASAPAPVPAPVSVPIPSILEPPAPAQGQAPPLASATSAATTAAEHMSSLGDASAQAGILSPSSPGGDSVASKPSGNSRRTHRDVVPGLPRAQTFARQQSELRENLLPVTPTPAERRATSMDRRLMSLPTSPTSPTAASQNPFSPRASAPNFSLGPQTSTHDVATLSSDNSAAAATTTTGTMPPVPSAQSVRPVPSTDSLSANDTALDGTTAVAHENETSDDTHVPNLRHQGHLDKRTPADRELFVHEEASQIDTASMSSSQYDLRIRYELEHIWILNLSMHFRDKSRREKFFVTYRQRPDLWRRVTVSLDYRNAPENSLEMDLLQTKYQRDKNEKIYEAIRESLVDIQFYSTVTNLKLQTVDGRLHVHVVEDVTEIIEYPTVRMVQHLRCRIIRERDIEFDSHMSGFVYKVRVDGRLLIKKEIPGPDSVDEFLYEVNALNFLTHSRNVIEFYGVIVDDDDRVRGLLIDYAEQGALIDIIYDCNHTISWATRAKWAHQIVQGLSEIHEAGFVQGDFTLSNIVIDNYGKAKIIDINRRGCPVGWEPPEATPLIESSQRISMYIGVKSDLYQLGMVLWALGMQDDEPEAHSRPLHLPHDIDVPPWFRTVVETCLDEDPRVRVQARQLLGLFPRLEGESIPSDCSDYDDEDWTSGPHHSTVYTPGMASTSTEDDTAGIQGSASNAISEYDKKSQLSDGGLAPHIRTVEPPSDWSYVNMGHTYVDPVTGFSNEPYYYPMRGRSPPSPMPSNYECDPSYQTTRRHESPDIGGQRNNESSRGRKGRRMSSSSYTGNARYNERKSSATVATQSATGTFGNASIPDKEANVESAALGDTSKATRSSGPQKDEERQPADQDCQDLARPVSTPTTDSYDCQDINNAEETKYGGAGKLDSPEAGHTATVGKKLSTQLHTTVLAHPETAA